MSQKSSPILCIGQKYCWQYSSNLSAANMIKMASKFVLFSTMNSEQPPHLEYKKTLHHPQILYTASINVDCFPKAYVKDDIGTGTVKQVQPNV